MTTGRIVVIPTLATHHKTPIPPTVRVKHPPPAGEDLVWDT